MLLRTAFNARPEQEADPQTVSLQWVRAIPGPNGATQSQPRGNALGTVHTPRFQAL